VLEQIELYLDRELPDDAKCGEIKAHLDACGECLDRAEFRIGLKALIAHKCGCQSVPADLMERVRREIESTQAP
jgi:mycothiol system anti-sigma-R factor